MPERPPRIDSILIAYFADPSCDASSRQRRLRHRLEAVAERVLGPRQRSLLVVERVLDPIDAFARVFGPEELLAALPLTLTAGRVTTDDEVRAQVDTAAGLAQHLLDAGLVSRSAHVLEFADLAARVDALLSTIAGRVVSPRRPTSA